MRSYFFSIKAYKLIIFFLISLFPLLFASSIRINAFSDDLPTLNIDQSAISVSGISSGAFFAVQLHVAFSKTFMGVGALAGGPFYCARDSQTTALTSCMSDPELINLDQLYLDTSYAEATLSIDATVNLQNARVWVLSARNDTIVAKGVVEKLQEYYEYYISNTDQLMAIYDLDGEHSFITNDYGNDCEYLGEPYMNNCNFDSAGSILQHIYTNELIDPSSLDELPSGSIVKFSQIPYVESIYTPYFAGLEDYGYAFVPDACTSDAQCKLHVSNHGCLMTTSLINTTYVEHSGFNAWGAANNIVILYPQARQTTSNPKGCFDWWGYTGEDYSCQYGVQMQAVKRMVDKIVG